jgi:hypothetical protein
MARKFRKTFMATLLSLAAGIAPLHAVNAGDGQNKRREKPVDIGDGPARHDGEGALCASLEPCDYLACGCGNGDFVRALRQSFQRIAESTSRIVGRHGQMAVRASIPEAVAATHHGAPVASFC